MKVMWVFLAVGTTMLTAGALLIYLGLDPTIAVAVVTGIGAAAAQLTVELLGQRRDGHSGPASITTKPLPTVLADDQSDAKPADDRDRQSDRPSTGDTM